MEFEFFCFKKSTLFQSRCNYVSCSLTFHFFNVSCTVCPPPPPPVHPCRCLRDSTLKIWPLLQWARPQAPPPRSTLKLDRSRPVKSRRLRPIPCRPARRDPQSPPADFLSPWLKRAIIRPPSPRCPRRRQRAVLLSLTVPSAMLTRLKTVFWTTQRFIEPS